MASLLLILIAVITIIAVAAVGPLITRRLSLRVNLAIAGGYLAVMLLSSVICAIIPASALRSTLDPVKASESFENAGRNIGVALQAGSLEAPEGIDMSVLSFDAPASVVLPEAEAFQGVVYVGIKGEDVPDDGRLTVDVRSYTCGFVVFNDTYYAIPVDPPSVILEDGVLTVTAAPEKTVNLVRFNDRSTVPQFFDTDASAYGGGTYAFQLVVVLLPPGTACTGGEPLSALIKQPVF